MTYWIRSHWIWGACLCLLALSVLFPLKHAEAASCSSTLSFAATGDVVTQNFQTCNTYIEPGSGPGWSDTSNARWAGMQTTLGHGVRGIFNCGIGVSNGSGSCSGTSPTTITTSNATYSVSGRSADSTLTFTLVSRNTSTAFTDNLTYYTYVGAAVASPSQSVTNTAYTFTVNVAAEGNNITLSPSGGALPDATLSKAYSQTFTASGGTAPLHWTATSLPGGLQLDATTGKLSGTPVTQGNYSFSVTATDATSASATGSYTLQVVNEPPVSQSSSATVSANSRNNVINYPYSGGTPSALTVTQSPAHGSAVVNGATLSYTPDAGYSGNDSLSYQLSNSGGTSSPATLSLTVSRASLTLSPAAGALPAATQGENWSQTITATGGSAPYTFSASGLPTGISLSSAGVLSGTPVSSGDYTFSVTATDVNGAVGSGSYSLHISAKLPTAGAVSASVAANSADNVVLDLTGSNSTSLALVQTARHGNLTVRGLRVLYTPYQGYSGADSFSYTVSDAGGTSAPASVTLTVMPPQLSMTPAAGTLPSATAIQAYRQVFTVTGGTAPYRFTVSGNLPAGMVFSGGELSGTPQSAGMSQFSVTATDSLGVTVVSQYSLTVERALPVAPDRSGKLYAGQTLRMDLVQGATGGPFSSAALTDQPDASMGSAVIEHRGNDFILVFKATPLSSGVIVMHYTLSSGAAVSQPGTISVIISSRPDPSRDADVIGTISAMTQSAEDFAKNQIRNFTARLEQLHTASGQGNDFTGIQVNLPQSRPSYEEPLQFGQTVTNGMKDAFANGNLPNENTTEESSSVQPPDSPLGLWTGGFVDFGSTRTNIIRFSHTLAGVSTGADYRLSPELAVGAGVGFGREVNDIGNSGSRTISRATSSALYGSFHPGALYLDGLLGYSWLNFDSRRYVTEMDTFARGDRSGHQIFASLTGGYEMRSARSLVAPYIRVDYAKHWLDNYSESQADAFNLAYSGQQISQLTGTVGLREEYGIPVSWGLLRLHSRLEYSRDVSDEGTAGVGYADTADNTWSVQTLNSSKEVLTFGAGISFQLPYNISPGISYQGTLGMDDRKSRSNMVMANVVIGF